MAAKDVNILDIAWVEKSNEIMLKYALEAQPIIFKL